MGPYNTASTHTVYMYLREFLHLLFFPYQKSLVHRKWHVYVSGYSICILGTLGSRSCDCCLNKHLQFFILSTSHFNNRMRTHITEMLECFAIRVKKKKSITTKNLKLKVRDLNKPQDILSTDNEDSQ